MSDEQIVEVVAQRFRDLGHPGRMPEGMANEVLAALREAGWDVYRPEECVEAALRSLSLNLHQSQRLGFDVVSLHQVPTPVSLSSGGEAPRYRLVPVEGD
ncbi:MAG TPA: hypothetical protein VIG24_04905 [Acidimicrobiia bacterium]